MSLSCLQIQTSYFFSWLLVSAQTPPACGGFHPAFDAAAGVGERCGEMGWGKRERGRGGRRGGVGSTEGGRKVREVGRWRKGSQEEKDEWMEWRRKKNFPIVNPVGTFVEVLRAERRMGWPRWLPLSTSIVSISHHRLPWLSLRSPSLLSTRQNVNRELYVLTICKIACNLVRRWPHAILCPNACAADTHNSWCYISCTS